jgi:hypothetical protein
LHLASSSADPTISLSRDPGSGNVNFIKSDFYDLTFTSYRHLLFTSSGTTERARIDSSGRLLVGTSSTSEVSKAVFQGNSASSTGTSIVKLTLGNASPGSADELGKIQFADSSHVNAAQIAGLRDGGTWTSGSSQPTRLVFSTTADGASSPTERIRINNEGYTTLVAVNGVQVNSSLAAAGTTHQLFEGKYSGSAGGPSSGTRSIGIFTNGNVVNTNNSYGAISDIKLKENVVDAGSQWSDLKALQVRKYNFKEGQTHTQIGLVAQEVELVSPGLVSESPDRDAEGNDLGTVTKSVNYSVLYMKAVKALQEAMERIEQLESKVAALESA